MRSRGEPAGVRAGLELLGDGARVLFAGANVGGRHGLFRHGAVNPWRLFISAQGDALVLGYGLPDAGMLDQMRVELLRYTPPERMRGDPEALPADLFGLALVSYELIVGDEEGTTPEQVPLRKLNRRLTRYPMNINKAKVDALDTRLRALGTKTGIQNQMPKGPLPQGAKVRNMQRSARRRG